MLTFEQFSGIDNQHASSELVQDAKTRVCALASAVNIDLDLAGRPSRRQGYAQADSGIWRNTWNGAALRLATKDGDLVNRDTLEVLYETLSGTPRTWFGEFPDGRVCFSNGLICGITDGTAAGTTRWGVPIPASVGAVGKAAGDLYPGRYQYAVTHVRTLDGLEGGPLHAAAFTLAEGEGSIVWTGLPAAPAGHTTNVYLSSHDGETLYLAASTSGTVATFTGANVDLQLPLKTDQCFPAPAGICIGYWRGRSLLASGNLLIASRPQQWELFDLSRDVKAFPADITMVMPVQDGIWVGTQSELAFLSGTAWDDLQAHHDRAGAVAFGSGVLVDGRLIGSGEHPGPAALCIADGYLTAGYSDGAFQVLTDRVYRASGAEYVATLRRAGARGEIPQYVAIEQ